MFDRSSRQRLLPFIALVLSITSCGGEGGTGTSFLPQCDRSVQSLTVSSGTTPRFTWEPECRMGALHVYRAQDFESMWFIDSGWKVEPGIRYGAVPRGASASSDATPLEAGVEYVVDIMPPVGDLEVIPVLGRERFTP